MVDFLTGEEALAWLDTQGSKADSDLNIFEIALAIAAQENPGKSLDSYRQHMRQLCRDLEEVHLQITDNLPSSLEKQIQSFQMVFAQKHGYDGDAANYDNMENINIMRVIDRRMGMPITLSLLCLHIGREIGWSVHGLNFPGHFLLRLDFEGHRAIIDPFRSCKSMQAQDLREILKKTVGDNAELSNAYYEPTTNRDMMIRLHNNVKLRLIEAEDYSGALNSIELIRRIMPDEYRLNLDAGILQARLEQPMAAIHSLQTYIDLCPDPTDRAQAESLISQIRGQIN